MTDAHPTEAGRASRSTTCQLQKGEKAFSPDEVRKLRQQIKGMQAVVHARETAVRSLQAQIADLYTKATRGISDKELARALKEAFQRTRRLQAANDDLRLRLYGQGPCTDA